MWLLWLITALWAASFSLIGEFLAGQVDGYIAVFIRMTLAFLVLLPALRWRQLNLKSQSILCGIGALQIGVMYLFLYHAFLYLSVAEVLLFTIFTPLYIMLIDEVLFNRKRLPLHWWLASLLAVVGAAIIRYDELSRDFWFGFLLIQAANLCFAAGQVFYKRSTLGSTIEQTQQFAGFFLGALIISGSAMILFADFSKTPSTTTHWLVLLWLGIVASGLGYLGWNLASKWVNTAQLATMNNVLIPAGLLINFWFWGINVNWLPLVIGGIVLMLSVWLASKPASTKTPI